MATININIDKAVFNAVYLPYLDNKSRYEVLYGGAGSGKSHFVAQKKIRQHLKDRGRKTLVVRKVAKTIKNSVFTLLQDVMADWNVGQLFNVNKSDFEITCINGNKFIFAGLDDVEKLKSIAGVTDIWVEEASEITQEDLQQLDLRLRGKNPLGFQMTLTFNPISITHWLKKYFFDSQMPNASMLKTTYKDNRFLDEQYIEVLESLKDKDPYYYAVYCLGEWGITGKTIFPAQIVTERLAALRDKPPIREGFFVFEYEAEKIVDSTIRWIDEPGGYIKVYEDPAKYTPYVVGGDTAGDGSDYFTGAIINNVTGQDVAVLRHQFDEDLYARQMYCLGKHYNTALLGIETNFSTFPVKELQRLGYHRQFLREHMDSISRTVQEKYGFLTTKLTRAVIIADLVKEVREHIEHFRDIETLEEMLTFVRNEKGKAEASEGNHDDLIMARAIARHISWQQRDYADVPPPDKTELAKHKDELARVLQRSRKRLI
jgi:phage terminase large subunit